MTIPRHLESLIANLSPSTSLLEVVNAHRDFLVNATGEWHTADATLADIDRHIDAAWTARAEQEAKAGWGDKQEQAIAAVVNDEECPY